MHRPSPSPSSRESAGTEGDAELYISALYLTDVCKGSSAASTMTLKPKEPKQSVFILGG